MAHDDRGRFLKVFFGSQEYRIRQKSLSGTGSSTMQLFSVGGLSESFRDVARFGRSEVPMTTQCMWNGFDNQMSILVNHVRTCEAMLSQP